MFGQSLRYFFINIGIGIAVAIVTGLVIPILGFLPLLFNSTLPLIIISCIIGFMGGGGSAAYFIKLNPESYNVDSYLEKRSKMGKPVKVISLIIAYLPSLCIAIPFLIIFINLISAYGISDGHAIGDGDTLICLLPAVILYYVVWFIAALSMAISSCCKGCGCVMYWSRVTSLKSDTGERTKERTFTTYGTFADVYLDNEKIGELKGETGETTDTTVYRWFSSKGLFRCRHCARTKQFGHYEEYKKDSYSSHNSYY